jgi:hypothetical protein
MNYRRTGILLAALSLLIITLFVRAPHVQALGTASYTFECPIIHVWGTTDDPIPLPSGMFVGGSFFNLTTGFSFAYYPPVTSSGSNYVFDEIIDFSRYGPVGPGHSVRIRIWERFADLLDVTVVCLPAFDPNPFRTGYEQRTIVCNTPVLDTPGGSPMRNFRVSAGQKRFVMPKPVLGPDGQLYLQVRVNAKFVGFILLKCVT